MNGHGTVSLNRTMLPCTHNTRPAEASTVNTDCTGSVTYKVTLGAQSAPDAHFQFVIVDDGREIKRFPADTGLLFSAQRHGTPTQKTAHSKGVSGAANNIQKG